MTNKDVLIFKLTAVIIFKPTMPSSSLLELITSNGRPLAEEMKNDGGGG
jgi:hypothetical protein